jgi:hypothetical protein
MFKRILSLVLLSTSLSVSAANVNTTTGQEYVTFMQSKEGTDRAWAYGYFYGVAEGFQGINHCIPDNVKGIEVYNYLTQVFLKEGAARDATVRVVILHHLKELFPCAEKQGGTL